MHPCVYKRPLLWCLVVWIAVLAWCYRPMPKPRDISYENTAQEVTLTGRVADFPVFRNGRAQAVVAVSSVNGHPAQGKLWARFADFVPSWKDAVEISGRLQTPYSVRLPGHFDWKSYLARKHIFTEMKVSRAQVAAPAAWPWRVVRAVRSDILQTLSNAFPANIAHMAGGVMLGERGELPADLYTAFQDSGAIHLLVASGGNVGFVILLTLMFGMWANRRAVLLLSLATAGLYTLVAGADAPLIRAYLMAVGACVGYLLGRNSGSLQGLLLSCAVIIGFSPASVFDTGFQMSFLATLAIVIFLNNYRIPVSWPAPVRFFGPIFLATLSSQLALLPVFTNVFYKVSLTGLLSNMLLVPLASLLMGLGFAYYALSVLHIGVILYYPCLWGFELFGALVQFFASFRFSALPVTAWNGGSIAAYYVLLFWLAQLPHKSFAKRLAVPCLGVAIILWGVGQYVSSKPKVYLMSEWNHRAAIVRVDRNTALVFNDGLTDEKLTRVLAALGIQQADFAASFSAAQTPYAPARVTKTAFTQLWPGEVFATPKYQIKAVWEKRRAQDGHLWENVGYTGREKDGLSYCVSVKTREICIGGQARFVQLPNENILSSEPNDTVQTAW